MLPDEQYEDTWGLLLHDTSLHGLAARHDDGTIIGITHFLFHASAWTTAPVCYLQDLFALPAERGLGVGRALIQGVCEQAKSAGIKRVYWQTHETNAAGRMLYDKVAKHAGFIVYALDT